MICYRDMTFCTFHEGCAKAKDCPRPLTEDVRVKADAWWNGRKPTGERQEAPIAVFAEKPECYSEEP